MKRWTGPLSWSCYSSCFSSLLSCRTSGLNVLQFKKKKKKITQFLNLELIFIYISVRHLKEVRHVLFSSVPLPTLR